MITDSISMDGRYSSQKKLMKGPFNSKLGGRIQTNGHKPRSQSTIVKAPKPVDLPSLKKESLVGETVTNTTSSQPLTGWAIHSQKIVDSEKNIDSNLVDNPSSGVIYNKYNCDAKKKTDKFQNSTITDIKGGKLSKEKSSFETLSTSKKGPDPRFAVGAWKKPAVMEKSVISTNEDQGTWIDDSEMDYSKIPFFENCEEEVAIEEFPSKQIEELQLKQIEELHLKQIEESHLKQTEESPLKQIEESLSQLIEESPSKQIKESENPYEEAIKEVDLKVDTLKKVEDSFSSNNSQFKNSTKCNNNPASLSEKPHQKSIYNNNRRSNNFSESNYKRNDHQLSHSQRSDFYNKHPPQLLQRKNDSSFKAPTSSVEIAPPKQVKPSSETDIKEKNSSTIRPKEAKNYSRNFEHKELKPSPSSDEVSQDSYQKNSNNDEWKRGDRVLHKRSSFQLDHGKEERYSHPKSKADFRSPTSTSDRHTSTVSIKDFDDVMNSIKEIMNLDKVEEKIAAKESIFNEESLTSRSESGSNSVETINEPLSNTVNELPLDFKSAESGSHSPVNEELISNNNLQIEDLPFSAKAEESKNFSIAIPKTVDATKKLNFFAVENSPIRPLSTSPLSSPVLTTPKVEEEINNVQQFKGKPFYSSSNNNSNFWNNTDSSHNNSFTKSSHQQFSSLSPPLYFNNHYSTLQKRNNNFWHSEKISHSSQHSSINTFSKIIQPAQGFFDNSSVQHQRSVGMGYNSVSKNIGLDVNSQNTIVNNQSQQLLPAQQQQVPWGYQVQQFSIVPPQLDMHPNYPVHPHFLPLHPANNHFMSYSLHTSSRPLEDNSQGKRYNHQSNHHQISPIGPATSTASAITEKSSVEHITELSSIIDSTYNDNFITSNDLRSPIQSAIENKDVFAKQHAPRQSHFTHRNFNFSSTNDIENLKSKAAPGQSRSLVSGINYGNVIGNNKNGEKVIKKDDLSKIIKKNKKQLNMKKYNKHNLSNFENNAENNSYNNSSAGDISYKAGNNFRGGFGTDITTSNIGFQDSIN
ncbi:hypothetical protein HDU92_003214 [Lobulomyces angularis]|nr:hypothetical protein HDU92_003214 [Lobulomyces angularis]